MVILKTYKTYNSGLNYILFAIIGAILAKVGEAETKIGEQEKEFVNRSSEVFIQPLKGFLEGQMRSIQVTLDVSICIIDID